MTISKSKTWFKLNQIDCESRLNLNWLRKMFVAMTFWSYYLPAPYPNQELMTISTAIAKIQQRKIEIIYLPHQQPFSPLQSLFWSLTLDISYSWNTINA